MCELGDGLLEVFEEVRVVDGQIFDSVFDSFFDSIFLFFVSHQEEVIFLFIAHIDNDLL